MRHEWRVAALTLLLLAARPALALGPMYSNRDLVAGEGTAGMEDGPFYSAEFRTPLGMDLDPDQNCLYVADWANHRIRKIDLSKDNLVSTVAGTGQAGYKDGPLETAAFDHPQGVVLLPGGRLVINDSGNYRFRLVDLKTKMVSTLAGNGETGPRDGKALEAQVSGVWNMAYLPQQDAIYFTQPDSKAVRKLDLKTQQISSPVLGDERIPHPGALCVGKGKLYVADHDKGQVFELAPITGKVAKGESPFSWAPLGDTQKVLALAWTANRIYALQNDLSNPMTCVAPSHGLSLISAWGDIIEKPVEYDFFKDVQSGQPMALVADPRVERRFYLSHPFLNNVTSLRDLDFYGHRINEVMNSQKLLDYEYPFTKPPKVFRILLVGDSHLYRIQDADHPVDNPMALFGKQLELMLNTMAAEQDLPNRFEVLIDAQNSHFPLGVWPYYSVPPVVSRYDVDEVLLFLTSVGYGPDLYSAYLRAPLTAEGIPPEQMDLEYMLKPAGEKVKSGPLKKLYDLCQAKKLTFDVKENLAHPDQFQELIDDPETRDCVIGLFCKPIQMLKAKLEAHKTSAGSPVVFETCFLPLFRFHPQAPERPFWKGCLEKIGLPYIDLNDSVTAFRVSFYPGSELHDFDHYSSQGHLLTALLLAQELGRQKPFRPGP